jgi:outer membrane lipoprotein SlyB
MTTHFALVTEHRKQPTLRTVFRVLALVSALPLIHGLGGCATMEKHPVLYPNAYFERVGNSQAQADVDACMQRAKSAGLSATSGGKVLEGGAKGAAIAGAAAAAAAVVRGNDHALRDAAAGAAAGGAGGAVHGAFQANEPEAIFKQFVNRCLHDKGYDVIGWK